MFTLSQLTINSVSTFPFGKALHFTKLKWFPIAKKIIEDFYGLNKLEYDEEKSAQIDEQNTQLALQDGKLIFDHI